jgi:L-ascorbate metabolism protein UlaG (beta-lactamase superfamily)
MITPALQNDALLADIQAAPASPNQCHLWWLGQSGYLVKWQESHLLIDPYLSDSLTVKYAGTPQLHVPMTKLPIDPTRLDMIDVVTSSHNHTDHLDPATLIPLSKANPRLKLVLPEANIEYARKKLGPAMPTQVTGLDSGSIASVDSFMFTGIPAAHNEVSYDHQNRCKYLGYVIRFGPFTLFHSGDTLWHRDLLDYLWPYHIDLALLPINGNKPERKVAGNLTGAEAAALARASHANLAVPCHYDMFKFNTETPDDFVDVCQKLNQAHRILDCGERLTLEAAS